MFIRTLDQSLISHEQSICKAVQVAPQFPRRKNIYPLRFLARVFAVIGMATAVYATTLIGLFFQSGIIAF